MRLFVAVDPSDEVRAALGRAIEAGRVFAPDAKWQREEAIHLTLAFLGNVPDEREPAIEAALRQVAGRHAPLALRVGEVGSFGSLHRPRVLWVGLDGALAGLTALKEDVEAALAPLGYVPEERAFRPHLTLARAREPRGDARLAEARAGLGRSFSAGPAADFTAGDLILYQSHLSPHGAKYTPRARLPLAG